MPLHTLIELEPRPDGTMVERRYKINIDATDDSEVQPPAHQCWLAITPCQCCHHVPTAASCVLTHPHVCSCMPHTPRALAHSTLHATAAAEQQPSTLVDW